MKPQPQTKKSHKHNGVCLGNYVLIPPDIVIVMLRKCEEKNQDETHFYAPAVQLDIITTVDATSKHMREEATEAARLDTDPTAKIWLSV